MVMQKSEAEFENEAHKIFLEFEIHTNHLTQERRHKLLLLNKDLVIWWFCCASKTEWRKIKNLELARELKIMKHKDDISEVPVV